MLQLSSYFANRPVLSLRAGTPIATITSAIIDPDNLKIEGFYCDDRRRSDLILLCQDIREMLRDGFVIDDYERLAEAKDLVRLEKILDLGYQVIGKQVVTIDKHKVGKVSDYAIDTDSMYIQKIYVAQSILKNFTGGSLSIDRSQIHETTPQRIVISELQPTNPLTATAPVA